MVESVKKKRQKTQTLKFYWLILALEVTSTKQSILNSQFRMINSYSAISDHEIKV